MKAVSRLRSDPLLSGWRELGVILTHETKTAGTPIVESLFQPKNVASPPCVTQHMTNTGLLSHSNSRLFVILGLEFILLIIIFTVSSARAINS